MGRLYLFVGDQSFVTPYICSVLVYRPTSSSPPRYKHRHDKYSDYLNYLNRRMIFVKKNTFH